MVSFCVAWPVLLNFLIQNILQCEGVVSAVEIGHLRQTAKCSGGESLGRHAEQIESGALHLHLLQVAVQGVLVRRQEPVLLQPQDQLRLLVGLQSQQVHEALAERPVLRCVLLLRAAGDDDRPRGPPQRRNVRLRKCRFPDLNLLPWRLKKSFSVF